MSVQVYVNAASTRRRRHQTDNVELVVQSSSRSSRLSSALLTHGTVRIPQKRRRGHPKAKGVEGVRRKWTSLDTGAAGWCGATERPPTCRTVDTLNRPVFSLLYCIDSWQAGGQFAPCTDRVVKPPAAAGWT